MAEQEFDIAAIEIRIADLFAEQNKRIEALEKQIELLKRADYHCAPEEHYHDEYANVDHVERSENSLERKISRVEESVNNLEYRVNDAERKVERAQSTADSAARQARGGW